MKVILITSWENQKGNYNAKQRYKKLYHSKIRANRSSHNFKLFRGLKICCGENNFGIRIQRNCLVIIVHDIN